MLWVLIRSASVSNEYPQHMVLLRNKTNIDTFWLKKKSALSRAMPAVFAIFFFGGGGGGGGAG